MRSTDRPLLGIFYINAAIVIMASNDALVRILASHYSPIQIAFVRVAVMALSTAIVIACMRRADLFKARQIKLLILRGLMATVSAVSFFYSLEYLKLADAFTISMTGPIIVALSSRALLSEPVPISRWVAILLGFASVAFIMRPGGGLLNIWAFLALLSAVSYAVAMMTNRKLTITEHSLTILFYYSLFSSLSILPALPSVWITPSLDDVPMLLGVGIFSAITQFLVVQAYRYAVASTVIAFDYMAVIYAALLGMIILGEIPSWSLVAGGTVLVICGVYIVYDESRSGMD